MRVSFIAHRRSGVGSLIWDGMGQKQKAKMGYGKEDLSMDLPDPRLRYYDLPHGTLMGYSWKTHVGLRSSLDSHVELTSYLDHD